MISGGWKLVKKVRWCMSQYRKPPEISPELGKGNK